MNKILIVLFAVVLFLLIDYYVFQAIRHLMANSSITAKNTVRITYWSVTAITIGGFLLFHFANPDLMSRVARNFIVTGIFVNYFSKIFVVFFLFMDDIIRAGKWVVMQFQGENKTQMGLEGGKISRSDFLTKTALIAGAIPAVAMGFGIISGAYDYRVRRKTVFLPNLPKEFDGLKIAQLSDIHSGSFFNKTAVNGGVDLLLKQKPDVVFFTGDLVNTYADEVKNYIDVFSRVKAPLGVYSTLGNHDYGDYAQWKSEAAKAKNLQQLIAAHHEMGWDILMNENRTLMEGNGKISIIGVENWGAGRFAKYGDLKKAYQGSEEGDVKLLLSHDPSHWDAQIKPDFPAIDLTFSGHTHGFQFGIEVGNIKWSPVKYFYKQWAGLYQDANQYLYVNRGYGFLGFPGRIGMPPEITIIELKKGAA